MRIRLASAPVRSGPRSIQDPGPERFIEADESFRAFALQFDPARAEDLHRKLIDCHRDLYAIEE